MTRFIAAVAVAVTAAGCFYTDPINARPSATMQRVLPVTTPLRGDPVAIDIHSVDPDGDPLTITWTASACDAGTVVCADTPFDTGVITAFDLPKIDFTVPDHFGIGVTEHKTRAIKVVAHVEDTYGAPSLQDAVLPIDVADLSPVIQIQHDTVGPPAGPTLITAAAHDDDDTLDALAFTTWTVYPARGSTTHDFTKVGDNVDVADRVTSDETYQLVPDVEGRWTVEVTVVDPVGTSTVESQDIIVGPDSPPCIRDEFPSAPPDGATLTLDDLRRFSVLVVGDDLDVFPPPSPNDPYRGEATFRWFLASPTTGGVLTELTNSVGNAVELDPAAFDPGDHLDLRVEIADRVPRSLPCPTGDSTCSIDNDSCIQRLTWAMEVR